MLYSLKLSEFSSLPPENSEVEISELKEFDFDLLYNFEMEHFSDAPNFKPSKRTQWISDLKGWLESDSTVRWFYATERGTLAATLSLYCENENICFIQALVVKRSLRRKGIAKELLNFVFSDLKRKGFPEIRLKVDPRNLPARRLYEKMGMKSIQP